jgi:DNA helicase-2/ATP-dependent DNA helicase PcrA
MSQATRAAEADIAPSAGQFVRGGLTLSAEQAAVVDAVLANSFTVVNAGAGAGKTRTTVAAALELLGRRPETTLDQFVLITFTNKAADVLRRRLEEALTKLQNRAPTAAERRRLAGCRERLAGAYMGTIHGFCSQLLRTFGYGALVARLSDVDSSRGLLYEAVEEVLTEILVSDGNNPLRDLRGPHWPMYELQCLVLEVHEDLRNRGLDPSRVAEGTARQDPDAGQPFRAALAEAVAAVDRAYTARKAADNKLDATDLLLHTAKVLEGPDGAAVARNLGRRHRYLFIDEFQDTDALQKRIVDRLQPHLARVMVVGDAKQSIYGFRGAGLSLQELAEEKGVELLRLSISRRPTEQLLAAYNALFASMGRPNPAFAGSPRYPELGQPLKPHEGTIQATNNIPPLTLLDAGARTDRQARIALTARVIRRLIGKPLDEEAGTLRPLEAGDIAILFRGNEALGEYAEALRGLLSGDGIEVRREPGERFYRTRAVVAAYRLLRVLLDYPSDVALALALETPYLRDVSLDEVEASLLWHGRKRDHELTDRFEADYPDLAARLRGLRSALRTDTVPELLGRMDEQLGLRAWHRARGDRAGEEALERLREVARSLVRSEQALTAGVFADHLRHCIRSDAEGPEDAPADEAAKPSHVRLMTVHAAKGLEFPVMVLPELQAPVGNRGFSRFVVDEQEGLDVRLGALRGVLQTESAHFWRRLRIDQNAALFEEMRIFYVAVTRAQNHVVLIGADTAALHRVEAYSWQDEVLAAWPELAARGARRTGGGAG